MVGGAVPFHAKETGSGNASFDACKNEFADAFILCMRGLPTGHLPGID